MSSDAHRLVFELGPQLDEIGRLTRGIEAFGKRHGLPSMPLHEAILALDELVTNVLHHGVAVDETAPVGVEVSYEGDVLTIMLSDRGRPFDPSAAPTPDTTASLAARKVGGLGLHLARELVDSLSYRYDDGRNRVTIVKRMRKEA